MLYFVSAINETRIGSLNPQTESNQGERVWTGGRGEYNLFVVADLHGDRIFVARNLRSF